MSTYNNWWQNSFLRGGSECLYADIWNIEFKHTELLSHLNFKQSVRRALELMSEKNKKIIVQYSGGLDSEIIIREACDMGLDVIPYTVRFLNDLNDHEIYYAKQLEKELGIRVEYLDLDIVKWSEEPDFIDGYVHYIREENMLHPAAPMNWWARNRIAEIEGDCVVTNGSGDPTLTLRFFKTNADKLEWSIGYNLDGHYKRFRFAEKYYPDDVPMFFMYIPEIHYSMLTSDVYKHCVSANSYKLGSNSTRHALYKQTYPTLIQRPKYSGYEKVVKLNINTEHYNVTPENCSPFHKPWTYDQYLRKLEKTS